MCIGPVGSFRRHVTAPSAPATGNPQQPHTEPPLKANESFIMILLFSLWLLKPLQLALALSGFLCVFSLMSFTSQRALKPDLCFYMVCMKGYLTYTYERHAHTYPHTHTHTRTCTHFPTKSTCAPLYWPSLLLFLSGILKAVFTAALCALWSVQELQQILKYWLLSLLEEKESSSRGREMEMER